jgi:hypothetical protein
MPAALENGMIGNTPTVTRLDPLPFLGKAGPRSLRGMTEQDNRVLDWLHQALASDHGGEIGVVFQYRHGSVTGAEYILRRTERLT